MTKAILQTAATVLAKGFADDPMMSFLFPDSDTRLKGRVWSKPVGQAVLCNEAGLRVAQ